MPPLKLIFRSRKERFQYGVVAESIQQLKQKAKTKFSLASDVEHLVVELEDGTIIEDEDYFSLLDKDTCLVVSEKGSSGAGGDVVDGMIHSDGPHEDRAVVDVGIMRNELDIGRLANKLQKDVTSIVGFSNQQLEVIANATDQELQGVLNHMTVDEIEALQEACHTHLVEREKTTDAIYLLRMCNGNAEEESQSSSRRKRLRSND